MTCKHNWHFKERELLICQRCGSSASANARPYYTLAELAHIIDPERMETKREFKAREAWADALDDLRVEGKVL